MYAWFAIFWFVELKWHLFSAKIIGQAEKYYVTHIFGRMDFSSTAILAFIRPFIYLWSYVSYEERVMKEKSSFQEREHHPVGALFHDSGLKELT